MGSPGGALTGLWLALMGAIRAFCTWLLEAVADLALELWNRWILPLWYQALDFVVAVVPQEWVEYVNQRPWDQALEYVEDFNWFFPVYACVGIWATAWTLCLMIRAVRHAAGAVPALNLG